MRGKISIGLTFLLSLALLNGCNSNETSEGMQPQTNSNEETQEFRVVSFLAMNHQFTEEIVPMWIEKVESATEGAVTFEWIGGPESVPLEDQFDAVVNGTVEVGFNVSSYYGHLVPEAHSLNLSPYTPEEEREVGYFDYLQERHSQHGLEYVGRWLSPSPYYLWTNEKIETLEDLEGMEMRSNPTYDGILGELGISPVTVDPSDVYTSLERNMVDGFGFPLLGPHQTGWTEVTEYIIDEPFLNQNATILFNSSAFDSLSSEVQETIHNATAEFEKEMVTYFNEKNEEEWEDIQAAGVEKIILSSEDSKDFQDKVDFAFWKRLEEDVPEEVDVLKEIFEN